MAGPTEEQHDYMHALTGKNPRDYATSPVPGGASGASPASPPVAVGDSTAPSAPADQAPVSAPQAAPAAPFSFSPLKPQAPSLLLDPNLVAAMSEAEQWVRNYLATNSIAPAPGSEPGKPPTQLLFGGTVKPLDTVVKTTVAAGRMANLQTGAVGRQQITVSFVTRIIRSVVAPPPATKDDDSPIEVTRDGDKVDIQLTIKLHEASDDDASAVQVLPDVEVTLHVTKDSSDATIEAQLNLVKIKADLSKKLKLRGHVLVDSVEFKLGVSEENDASDALLLRVRKWAEPKIKAELSFKIAKGLEFKIEADGGSEGGQVTGKLIYRF
jgi:hypothetical protein